MRKKRSAGPQKGWQDHYARKAKKENYPARSVYKLQELQRRFGIIRKGDRVLDLGCAPGSWMLYAARQTGPGGKVIGVDLQKVEVALPAQARAIQADALAADDSWLGSIGFGFDVVLSDMAPSTTGSAVVDTARSYDLSRAALALALKVLKPGGIFVCKIFQGEDFNAFCRQVRPYFKTVKNFKPRSSRKASREMFVVGVGRKTPVQEGC